MVNTEGQPFLNKKHDSQLHHILSRAIAFKLYTMGACLSCLRGSDQNDDELNENSSLLRGQHNQYSSDYLQEAELLKQQQRQQELNTIVNDLSDNLIDVTSFLNNEQPQTSEINGGGHNFLYRGDSANTTVDETDQKNFPAQYTQNQRLAVLKSVTELNSSVKDSCKITFDEPLYLVL